MGKLFTLDSIREEVEKEYAPLDIGLKDGTTVTLRNLLRLGEGDRKKVLALIDALKSDTDEDEDAASMLETVSKIIPIVADSPAKGRKLVAEIGGDLAVTANIFEKWMGAGQLGEAESSPS